MKEQWKFFGILGRILMNIRESVNNDDTQNTDDTESTIAH